MALLPTLPFRMFNAHHRNNNDSGVGPTVTTHYQLSSGRFLRLDTESFDNNQHGTNNRTSQPESRRERLVQIRKLSHVVMLFVQGALCGLCIQTLYHELATSMAEGNENRRLYFLAISFALTGGLCRITAPNSALEGKGPQLYDSSQLLVIVYSIALVVSLSSSIGCFQSLASQKGLHIARSILCIIGWLFSCVEIYLVSKNSRKESRH